MATPRVNGQTAGVGGTLKSQAAMPKPEPLKVLFAWRAPSRLFKTRDKEFFSTLAAIAFLLGVILFFLKEWFAIVVMAALAFLAYVFSTVRPDEVEYQITNRGLVVHGQSFFWPELGRFWFEEKLKQRVMYVERPLAFPYRLVVPLGQTDAEKVKKFLTDYLLFEQPERTWMENAGEWLSKKVPLEKES